MRDYNKSLPSTIFDIFNMLFMLALSFVFVAPVLHVLFASFSDPVELTSKTGIILWPSGFTLVGYRIIFSNNAILLGYVNSFIYLITGVTLSTLLSFMAGYALSRKNLLWRNVIMFLLAFTMFFSGGLIPFYRVVTKLGMYNTRWAVIVPTAVSPFFIIIMRTALQEIPASLEESAKIDGANHFTIMFKILLPVSKATVAVIALFSGVFIWNNWFHPSIFLRDRDKFPLQLILKEVLVANDTSTVTKSGMDINQSIDVYKRLVKYCTIVVSVFPVLCFYPFAQKYFVRGVMIGSIKG